MNGTCIQALHLQYAPIYAPPGVSPLPHTRPPFSSARPPPHPRPAAARMLGLR